MPSDGLLEGCCWASGASTEGSSWAMGAMEGGMGGNRGKVGTKLVPDTLGVPLVCPSGPKQLQGKWQWETVR